MTEWRPRIKGRKRWRGCDKVGLGDEQGEERGAAGADLPSTLSRSPVTSGSRGLEDDERIPRALGSWGGAGQDVDGAARMAGRMNERRA